MKMSSCSIDLSMFPGIRFSVIASILLSLFFLSACGNGYERDLSQKVLDYCLENDCAEYEVFIIIPQAGCPGCISSAENWARQHIDDEGILFVFTNILSEKMLQGRFRHYGIDTSVRHNVMVDRENNFFVEEYIESEYPYVVLLNKTMNPTVIPFSTYVDKDE